MAERWVGRFRLHVHQVRIICELCSRRIRRHALHGIRFDNMPNQLTWTCRECGRSARLSRVPERITCYCGHSEGESIQTIEAPPEVVGEHRDERLAVCEHCRDYIGWYRCKRIELGCKREFLRALNGMEPGCPLAKWSR